MTDFIDSYARYLAIRADLNRTNKQILFDALASAGIIEVRAAFDGEGDSGQIDRVEAFRGNKPVPIPETLVTFRCHSYGNAEPTPLEIRLPEAIERLCYDYLTEEYDGWENNDGGFGEFRFDVKERVVELEFHSRFIDVVTHNHTY